MTALLYVWIYICLSVSVAACIVRALRYSRAPLHLRWELYPVPHEAPKRAAYGGSRFEETDWWTKKEEPNKIGELKAMGAEMLFLKGVWEFNRGLWFTSYPFHLGLYLLFATGVMATAGALVPAMTALLHPLYLLTGLAGAALSMLGATGLLFRRLSDERLRIYTTPGDLFNLLFFIGTTAALLVAYAIRPEDAPGTGAILKGLLTFDTSVQLAGSQTAALALAAALIMYIPLTHMSHFIAKYFTYHAIRWDDMPNLNQKALTSKIAEYLTYRPTWSAPHVGADGKATWADIATKNPTSGDSK